jgi:hypothetical protein
MTILSTIKKFNKIALMHSSGLFYDYNKKSHKTIKISTALLLLSTFIVFGLLCWVVCTKKTMASETNCGYINYMQKTICRIESIHDNSITFQDSEGVIYDDIDNVIALEHILFVS